MVDMHAHSIESDGTDTPRQLAEKAKRLGLVAVAKTDHNSTNANEAFVEIGDELGIRCIPGVEISTRDPETKAGLHIVGLWVTPTKAMDEVLLTARNAGRIKSDFTLKALQAAGYNISREAVVHEAGKDNINNGNIAAYLLSHGEWTKSREELFAEVLETPQFKLKLEQPSPAQACDLIHDAGGVAVWAHPLEDRSEDMDVEMAFIRGVISRARTLDGIEVQHSVLTPRQRAACCLVGREFDLLFSGGSDYHGRNKANVELGIGRSNVAVPDEWMWQLLERHYMYIGKWSIWCRENK